jgi:hypothetical protein
VHFNDRKETGDGLRQQRGKLTTSPPNLSPAGPINQNEAWTGAW